MDLHSDNKVDESGDDEASPEDLEQEKENYRYSNCADNSTREATPTPEWITNEQFQWERYAALLSDHDVVPEDLCDEDGAVMNIEDLSFNSFEEFVDFLDFVEDNPEIDLREYIIARIKERLEERLDEIFEEEQSLVSPGEDQVSPPSVSPS
eukprot:Selendium_serpulae@DN6491_c2_g3_i2.p1